MNDCDTCPHKNCCRMFWVPLTPSEAKRLPVDWNGWVPRAAVLPRKKSGDCIFLNAEGKCDIYSVRPLACREYFCTEDARVKTKDKDPATFLRRL